MDKYLITKIHPKDAYTDLLEFALGIVVEADPKRFSKKGSLVKGYYHGYAVSPLLGEMYFLAVKAEKMA